MKFRVRIDGNDDTKVISFLSKYHEYIAVHHMVNDNPHYHFYLNDPMMMSAQTMRMRVRRMFEPTKRSDYSVKECNDGREDEYIQYLFNTKHGNVWRRVCDFGIDHNRIDRCIKNATDVSTEYENATKRRKSSNTVTVYDIAEEAVAAFKNEHGEVIDDEQYYTRMSYIVIDLCKKYRKGMDYNMIIKIMTTSLGIISPELLVRKIVEYHSTRYR